MGKVIGHNASIERIHEAAARALSAALARGSQIQAMAELRITPVITALGDNEQKLNQARAEDDACHAALLARDNESDLEIGAVCDEIWNAMGRPSQSPEYDMIVSGGKSVWTDADPTKQHYVMGVLAANIRNSKHPKLADKKEAWAKRIEDKAAAQAEAARPAEVSRAKVTTLTMQRRTMADAVQLGLTRFKRDLKNIGMTEAQIHEIIPDSPTASNGPKPAPSTPAPPA